MNGWVQIPCPLARWPLWTGFTVLNHILLSYMSVGYNLGTAIDLELYLILLSVLFVVYACNDLCNSEINFRSVPRFICCM